MFIAAGATVKPSLVFFKRFTEQEEEQYVAAKTKAENEIRQKYTGQIHALREKIAIEKAKRVKTKAGILMAEKELKEKEGTTQWLFLKWQYDNARKAFEKYNRRLEDLKDFIKLAKEELAKREEAAGHGRDNTNP